MGEPEDFIIAHCVHLGRVEVDALRATLAARDERVGELEAEVAEWQSRAKELMEEGCRGSDLNTRLCERIATLEAELAAIRPKAEAAERWAAAERHRDSLRRSTSPVPHNTNAWSAAYDAAQSRIETERQALVAACPEKGGAG